MSLLWILTALIVVPIPQANRQVIFGPRLDTLTGHFHQSPAIQEYRLRIALDDIWFDIRDPVILRHLDDDGYTVMQVPETYLLYYIAFNMRDQENPSGGGAPWRTESAPGEYYTYSGTQYGNYVPLNDTAFRHALAHCVPKDEFVATVYGGITARAINTVVPKAQREWHNPGVDGHPFNPGDPTANTTYPQSHDACSILRAAGYVWGNSTAPNPAPKYSYDDPDGNWLDPHTALAADNPGTPWNDTLGSPMNHITFAGVTEPIAPDSYGRDDMCLREWRHIGLPIEHTPIAYGWLTDNMMDCYQFDMYALGWEVGRYPDHLYGFFHSSNNFYPGGYNFPGINDTELDSLLETVQFSLNPTEVQDACWDAQDMIAEKLPYIVTVTRPAYCASAVNGADLHTDTLRGIVNSPDYGQKNDYTFCSLHWDSNVDEGNPLGIGGSANMIVGSKPTNYHPGYASTTDEWMVVGRLFDGLINIDAYTHHEIPWLATNWADGPWGIGMQITFTLQGGVQYHDGEAFDADTCKFSLEFARDQQIARARPMWQNLVNVVVVNPTTFTVFFDITSLWIFNYVAGPDVWLVNDAACWATMFPPHIYAGTTKDFRPEATPHRIVHLDELVGFGNGIATNFFLAFPPLAEHYIGDPARAVYVDGIETNGTYNPNTIDTATGQITFTTAPTIGAVITADYLEEGIAGLTCLVGTGPFMLTDLDFSLGGYAELTANRNWWMSVGGYDGLVAEQFHWIGDVSGQSLGSPSDGSIDVYDLSNAAKAYGTHKGESGYNVNVDIEPEPTYHINDDFIDIRDLAEISKNYGKKRDYP